MMIKRSEVPQEILNCVYLVGEDCEKYFNDNTLINDKIYHNVSDFNTTIDIYKSFIQTIINNNDYIVDDDGYKCTGAFFNEYRAVLIFLLTTSKITKSKYDSYISILLDANTLNYIFNQKDDASFILMISKVYYFNEYTNNNIELIYKWLQNIDVNNLQIGWHVNPINKPTQSYSLTKFKEFLPCIIARFKMFGELYTDVDIKQIIDDYVEPFFNNQNDFIKIATSFPNFNPILTPNLGFFGKILNNMWFSKNIYIYDKLLIIEKLLLFWNIFCLYGQREKGYTEIRLTYLETLGSEKLVYDVETWCINFIIDELSVKDSYVNFNNLFNELQKYDILDSTIDKIIEVINKINNIAIGVKDFKEFCTNIKLINNEKLQKACLQKICDSGLNELAESINKTLKTQYDLNISIVNPNIAYTITTSVKKSVDSTITIVYNTNINEKIVQLLSSEQNNIQTVTLTDFFVDIKVNFSVPTIVKTEYDSVLVSIIE